MLQPGFFNIFLTAHQGTTPRKMLSIGLFNQSKTPDGALPSIGAHSSISEASFCKQYLHLKIIENMKQKPNSSYEKQVFWENLLGIFFCLILTALFLLNKDVIVDMAGHVAVAP